MAEITVDIRERLAALRREYVRQLPEKICRARQTWRDHLAAEENQSHLTALHRQIHSLAGSGATFGCEALGQAARHFEVFIKQLLESGLPPSSTQQNQARLFLASLEMAQQQIQQPPSATKRMQIELEQGHKYSDLHQGKRVFLVDDDPDLTTQLDAHLRQYGYEVRVFNQLGAAQQAIDETPPLAIIMDMMFPEGEQAGAEAIRQINDRRAKPIPVIFMSVRDDFFARLTAVRAGSTHYFTKPLDIPRLIHTLDELVANRPRIPYRILVVDDDPELANAYKLHLEGADMLAQVVNNPFEVLDILRDFKPDVVLMDIYMPECSGTELTAIIRQQIEHASIPVLFLSTESAPDRQISALNQGGDSFLTKPIEPWHLVRAVLARAKRSRELSLSNERQRALLHELEYQKFALDQHAIVSVTNAQGQITYANQKFLEVNQYSELELLGQDHRIVNSGYHSRDFFRDMWNTISSGQVWHGEVRNRGKGGRIYWVATTVVPFLDQAGKPYQYISICTDITHAKQAEEALRLSEERFRRGQNYANIGTWDWNIETGELFWSERIAPLFGYGIGELETTYENFLAAVHPEDRQYVVDSISACVEKGTEYNIEHRIVWPDGSTIWVGEAGDVVRDANGKPLKMLGMVQDISRRKQAEAEALRARDDAERANQSKSDFLARMSHELRTPLNAILGFGQLMESDLSEPLGSSQRDNLEQIIKAGWHLLELINEVLDLAKIESGNIDLSIEDVGIADVLDDCLGIISPLAEQRNISIDNKNHGHAQYVAHADRTRLKQVLLNLLSNAIKYNREHGSITLHYNTPYPGRLRIEITDQGVGLTAEQQANLFQPFNRLGAENSEVQGTGIGLIIARHMIELMGGAIGVISEAGQGSTFWIELNLGHSLLLPPAERQGAVSVPASEFKANHRVLYIEDNPANLKLVAQMLTKRINFELITAHTGELGLLQARKHQPELIILDINLPGMDGFELRARLRLFEETRNIPVIALSAKVRPRDIERALRAGFQGYVTKPIEIDKLLAAIDKVIQNENPS
ncbi:MAG: response regulator [Sulfurimicrobium sp.]|nr:response regulator [Sulfurimicrobium sp.]